MAPKNTPNKEQRVTPPAHLGQEKKNKIPGMGGEKPTKTGTFTATEGGKEKQRWGQRAQRKKKKEENGERLSALWKKRAGGGDKKKRRKSTQTPELAKGVKPQLPKRTGKK